MGSKKTESEIAVKLLLCFDPGSNLGVLALSELLAPEAGRQHWKPAVVAGPGVLARPASRDLQGIQRFFEPLWRTIYVYDASLLLLDVRDWVAVCTPGGLQREGASPAAPPQLSRAAPRSVCPNTSHAAASSLHCFLPGLELQSGPRVLPPREQVLPPGTIAQLRYLWRCGINTQATYLALQDAQYSALQRAPPLGNVSHLLVADLCGDPCCADPAVRKTLNQLRYSACNNLQGSQPASLLRLQQLRLGVWTVRPEGSSRLTFCC